MALRMFSRALITRRNAATSSTWVAVMGNLKSIPGTRFKVFVKCWITAPVANDLSEPSSGAPSPDHPVRGPVGLLTDVERARICGTPRMTPGL
jgi:hypothetical protein